MAKPQGRDSASFRGELSPEAWTAAIGQAVLPLYRQHKVAITVGALAPGAAPVTIDHFAGQMAVTALIERYKTMGGFGVFPAQTALRAARAASLPAAVIFNIRIGVAKERGADVARYAFDVALLKE